MKKGPKFYVLSSTVVIPAQAGIQETANTLLNFIREKTSQTEALQRKANAELESITKKYQFKTEPLQIVIKGAAAELLSLMKKNKGILFDGTDVVNLQHGSLIHNVADKVTIPHGALAACKINGFEDVIKTVESLDRDAIEKWPDAKLVLIGAERKTKEEFKYSLKEGIRPKAED